MTLCFTVASFNSKQHLGHVASPLSLSTCHQLSNLVTPHPGLPKKKKSQQVQCSPMTPLATATSSSPMPHPLVEANSSPQPYEHVLDCVLKVFCTHCEPNYELPWAMTPQRNSTSSGFIIRGRQILTNAHSVEHYTSVKVKRRDCDTKFTATVVTVGNECDIALLKVDDDSFWDQYEADALDDLPYLTPGPLPHLQDSVLVIGYPSPGNQISVTAGVSSRVEMQQYVHGQGELLTVQIDAAVSFLLFLCHSCQLAFRFCII